jgi:hypothetical protein
VKGMFCFYKLLINNKNTNIIKTLSSKRINHIYPNQKSSYVNSILNEKLSNDGDALFVIKSFQRGTN